MKDADVKTKLTLETNDNRYIWESPYVDVSMEDILDAFVGMLVSATWQPSTIVKCFKEYAEDHDYLLDDGKLCDFFDEECEDKEYEDIQECDACEDEEKRMPEPEESKPFHFRKFSRVPTQEGIVLNPPENCMPRGVADITW